MITVLTCSIFSFAQLPDTLWTQTYGGVSDEVGYITKPASDGGYIVLAHTETFGGGGRDAYLIKTDAQGNEVWTQTYGGPLNDEAYNVFQTADGGYIFGGRTEPAAESVDAFWLVRTDAGGNEEWNRTYGGTGDDEGYNLNLTSDGNYIMVGITESYAANDGDIWLLKIDQGGDTLWTKTFDYGGYDASNYVEETADGGYAIFGYTGSNTINYYDILLIKTDADGNEEWHHQYGDQFVNAVYMGRQTQDGGYVLSGHVMDMSMTVLAHLLKVDASGNEAWSHSLGDPGYNSFPYVAKKDNGNLLAAGYTSSFGANLVDMYFSEFDADGIEQWSGVFGADSAETATTVTLLEDGFIATGVTNSFGPGDDDAYVVCFSWDTFVEQYASQTVSSFKLFSAYPNPFNPETTISFELPASAYVQLGIYDISGREVARLVDGETSAGLHEIRFDASELSSGVYFAKLISGNHQKSQKLLLLK